MIYAGLHGDMQNIEIKSSIDNISTGKSYGQKFFTKDTNIWFNCDRKNPTWLGGREQYGRKSSPTKYHIIPETYSDIIRYIQAVKKSGELDESPIAFICCHIDEYKSTAGQRQRMRTLGRIATKMNIEGKMEHIYYTDISMEEGRPVYSLLTQNTGFNSGRSPEGMWDSSKIPNNFQKIVEAIDAY